MHTKISEYVTSKGTSFVCDMGPEVIALFVFRWI